MRPTRHVHGQMLWSGSAAVTVVERRTFLVESYWPGLTEDGLRSVMERIAARPHHGEAGVMPLASLLVPADAMAILLVQAMSLDAVRVAAEDDDISFDRVVECFTVGLVPQRQQQHR